MELRHLSARAGCLLGLLLVSLLVAPAWVSAADPLETVREAFRASSKELHSAIGKGKYRHYDAVPGGDWQLNIEADVRTQFDGAKYHVDLTFETDETRRLESRRIVFDGEKITDAFFTPRAHPTGANARVFIPEKQGDGLARGAWRDFPWDVTNLAKNVWDPERLVQNRGTNRIEIRETSDGDVLGSYSLGNLDRVRVRFECPRRFGFNLAKQQVLDVGEDHPVRESSLQWRQGPTGLWYVTSLVETLETRDEKGRTDRRMRASIMYSRFEPNVKVDASRFTEESLQLPARSPIVDNRPGAKERLRRTR